MICIPNFNWTFLPWSHRRQSAAIGNTAARPDCIYWILFPHDQPPTAAAVTLSHIKGGIAHFTLAGTYRGGGDCGGGADGDKSLCTTWPEQKQSVMVQLCWDFDFKPERKLIVISHLIVGLPVCCRLTRLISSLVLIYLFIYLFLNSYPGKLKGCNISGGGSACSDTPLPVSLDNVLVPLSSVLLWKRIWKKLPLTSTRGCCDDDVEVNLEVCV